MWKRHYLLALACYLLIPMVAIVGGRAVGAIDPEWALGTANYERNFRLLAMVRQAGLALMMLVLGALWILTCFFLLKSKQRSWRWLPLAAFGQFGLIGLVMLRDNAPAPGDLHERFVRGLNWLKRVAYEGVLFVSVWVAAFQAMVLKRELMILVRSATTGVSAEGIRQEQLASSGMWAFAEGLEVLYLVALAYLLWPAVFNFAGRFIRRPA